ncbi:MAG: class I SAM-dependent methyltransferase [Christensenellaceae bacterium]|nr:class I SAM-dependent methyltransferase [Christensenellaceae bacterium]
MTNKLAPKIDKRIESIINQISCDTLADIGCDHGMVSVVSILRNRARRVIACDISVDCIAKAKMLAVEFSVSDKIDFVIGDGFKAITTIPDQVVIAGLGSHTIIDILSTNIPLQKLILAPHSKSEVLRSFINSQLWTIEKDFIVLSKGHFYPIIVVNTLKKEKPPYSADELLWGKNFPHSDCFVKMLEKEFLKCLNFAKKTPEVLQRISLASSLLKKYKM